MNLYDETVEKLEAHGKSFNDVVAICGNSFQISKEEFAWLSRTEYDNDYGAPEVATDLVIIGADWWLERNEYDGSEWWDFKQMPEYKKLPFKQITALTVRQAWKNGVDCSCGWETLDLLNPCGNEKGGATDTNVGSKTGKGGEG
jgi:hypothetical protein